LRIKQLTVTVNKMDDGAFHCSKARCDEITRELTRLVGSLSYKPDQHEFDPISHFVDDDMINKSSNLS